MYRLHVPPASEPQSSPQLVIVRHGETVWSRTGRHTGLTDVPLTETGEQRARALAPLLADRRFALVLSSPLQRARRTAELAGFAGRIETDRDLAEFDYGAYEGLTSPEIQQRQPGWELWRDGAPPGDTPGETASDVRVRVDRVIVRAQAVLDQGDDVVVFAHSHLLRALGAAWIDLPPDGGRRLVLATAGIAELGTEHGNRVLDRWNIG